jgi:O-antigen ligase
VQPIHLIDSRPRLDPRVVAIGVVLGAGILATAFLLGKMMDLESQVLALVIVEILLLTAFVAFYDITNSVVLWFFAVTCITRYTQLNMPGIPDMSGPRFMLVLMWAVFLVQVALRRRRPLPINRVEVWMLVLMGVHFANMVYFGNLTHSETRVSPITPFVNFFVFPFSIYYLVRNACSHDAAARKLLKAFAVLQVYLVVCGVAEHFRFKWLVFPPDILDPNAGGGRWYGARIRGPYLHSPVYGATMGMAFFMLLHLFNYTRSRWRWPMLLGLLLSPLACFYTLTRQAWLGLGLPMLIGPLFSRRQRVMILLMVLIALTFVFTVDWKTIADPEAVRSRATDEATGEARIAHYYVGFALFLDNPFFGQGLQRWDDNWEAYRRRVGNIHWMFGDIDIDRARETGAHNTFLRLAVELGLVGLIPYLLIFFYIFRASVTLYRGAGRTGLFGRELVLAFWQLAIAFLVCINFVDPSFDEFLHGFFLAVAAVIVRRAELVGKPAEAEAAGFTFGEKEA